MIVDDRATEITEITEIPKRMDRRLRVLCVLCGWVVLALAAAPAYARDPQDAPPGELLAPWVHGAARYKVFGYSDEGRQDNDLYRNQGEIDLDLTPSLTDFFPHTRLEALFRAVYDDEQLSEGAFNDRSRKRPVLNARELFVAVETETVEVRAGKQVFSWGKADIYNPTDTLNARDYTDPFDNEKIGGVSALARWLVAGDAGELSLEGVLVPVWFIPTRLPPDGSRYDFVPPDLPVPLTSRDLPDDELSSTQWGARAQGTIRALDLDAAVSFFHGYDHEPNLRRAGMALTPFYKREDVLGLSLARPIGRFEVHGEAGYFFHSPKAEAEYLEYVVGGNWRRSALLDEADELFLVLEYAAQAVTEGADPGVIESEFSRLFEQAILGRARYSFAGGDVTAEVTAILILEDDPNQYFQAKVAWRIRDWLKATVGADVLNGPGDSFFGQFSDDDRVFAFLEASF